MYDAKDSTEEYVALGLQVVIDCKDKEFIPEPKFSEPNKMIYLDSKHNNFMAHSFVQYQGHTYLIELEEDKILKIEDGEDSNSLFQVSVYFMDDVYGPERIFKMTHDAGTVFERRASASKSFIGFRDCDDLCLELRVQEQSNGCKNTSGYGEKENYQAVQ
ncbi:MAG: hypothetical protein KKE20_00600 [Nanoarchaeota archaeon]|nr:hypothetical protein [Nanoarchaeota archaeon]